jgi:hypothetical protein
VQPQLEITCMRRAVPSAIITKVSVIVLGGLVRRF